MSYALTNDSFIINSKHKFPALNKFPFNNIELTNLSICVKSPCPFETLENRMAAEYVAFTVVMHFVEVHGSV